MAEHTRMTQGSCFVLTVRSEEVMIPRKLKATGQNLSKGQHQDLKADKSRERGQASFPRLSLESSEFLIVLKLSQKSEEKY